jgi:ribonuclease P protein component
MASEIGCRPEQGGQSSSPAVTRVANASPLEASSVSSIRHRSDFDRIFGTGRKHRVGRIVVITAPGLPGQFRFGLVAGKKIGGAVERNRVKRRIRHAIRLAEPPLGFDAVVIGSRDVLDVPFERLVQWLGVGLKSGTGPGREQEEPSRDG